MPWAAIACAAVSVIASQARYEPAPIEPPLPDEPMDCTGCGHPLNSYKCEYCRKEYPMFGWFKKAKPVQPTAKTAAAPLTAQKLQEMRRSTSLYVSRPPAPAPSPSPSPDPMSPLLYGGLGYLMGGGSSHSGPVSCPAPQTERSFSSGGGGDFGGGGASGSWESSSSSSSSSYDSSSSSSSSDSGSSSSSSGGDW